MCRAARADRRPISLSGNCPNWYRRRFSSIARTPDSSGIGPAALFAVKSVRALRGSELLTDAGAQIVGLNGRVLDRQEFYVFPFAPQEQIFPQHVFQTETAGPAGHEGIGSLLRQSLGLRGNGKRGSCYGGRIAEDVCCGRILALRYVTRHGARNVHAPNGNTAEYIRQEIAGRPTRASSERDLVLYLYRGAASQRHPIDRGDARSVDCTGRIGD